MVRRLPWTHPHLKVVYGTERKPAAAATVTTNSSVSVRMVSRTPRGGRRLVQKSNYSRSGGRSYTPRGRRSSGFGRGGSHQSSNSSRFNGLFLEGNWYCNCEPRLLAKHQPVKKNGPNKDRLFYSCEKWECDFFLWEEDAETRAGESTLTLPPRPEETTLVAAADGSMAQVPTPGGGSAVKPAPRPTSTAAPAAPEAPPTPATQRSVARQRLLNSYFSTRSEQAPGEANGATGAAETPSRGRKRRVVFESDSDDEEDEYGLGELSPDEEKAINEAVERSAQKLRDAAPPSTPVGQSATRGAAQPTPQTVTRTLFPEAKRRRTDEAPGSANVSFSTAPPSPATIRPSSPPPASTPSREEEQQQLDPTEEVMALLEGQKVDYATKQTVRGILERFAMKAKGLAKGRDSVRAALKTKDERIAELQERVTSLESRNRVQREEIADFKASIMDLYSKH
ncbi:hypothetical protein EsH8_I_001035 [Colletotrichum jinshuiense]